MEQKNVCLRVWVNAIVVYECDEHFYEFAIFHLKKKKKNWR